MVENGKEALQSWWLTLTEEQQDEARRLVEDDPLPEWLVRELREAGVDTPSGWWRDDGQARAGVELVRFVADQDPGNA